MLGVFWNVEDNEFGFNVSPPEKPTTGRGILLTMSSLYDLLGFVAPGIIEPKLILQNFCEQGFGWDCEIGDAEV